MVFEAIELNVFGFKTERPLIFIIIVFRFLAKLCFYPNIYQQNVNLFEAWSTSCNQKVFIFHGKM